MIITPASASSFPDAPRSVFATRELLGDWCGPVRLGGHAGVIVEYADDLPATDTDDAVALALVYMRAEKKVRTVPLCLLQLDPLDLQVRALLRAHLNSPLVYVSEEDWKDEGFFACGVAGQAVYGILEPWIRNPDQLSSHEWVRTLRSFVPSTTVFVSYAEAKRCPKRNRGWGCSGHVYGLETGEEGKHKADAYYLDRGCAFLLDADTMLLPWPGGPRIWRRDAAEGAPPR
jgi:hypothetical protein